ncbi:MAG: hypothetical protein R3182_13045, partial [Draconibacterium sp.]|nr:hypothetical protein [Draconibacterium sp.]
GQSWAKTMVPNERIKVKTISFFIIGSFWFFDLVNVTLNQHNKQSFAMYIILNMTNKVKVTKV